MICLVFFLQFFIGFYASCAQLAKIVALIFHIKINIEACMCKINIGGERKRFLRERKNHRKVCCTLGSRLRTKLLCFCK